LAHNPEARRTVVAQVLEYAINLSSIVQLPPIPKIDGNRPFVDPEDVRNGLQEGDYLLIIAGDQLDSRAVKLSEALLARHLLRAWDLALVEVAVFEQQTDSGQKTHLLVPHIRGTIVPVHRQVVTIDIKGDRTRVEVTPTTPVATGEKWDEERFFAKAQGVRAPLRTFAEELRRFRDELSGVTLAFGRGAAPTVTLRKEGQGIITLNLGDDSVAFNKHAFSRALDEQRAEYYRSKLEGLFPEQMKNDWPVVKLRPKTAERDLQALSVLLKEVLTGFPMQARSQRTP